MKPKYSYVLYDERAILGSTDDAAVLMAYHGAEYQDEEKIIKEASRDVRDYGGSGLLCSYDETGKQGKTVTVGNERQVASWAGGKITRY